MTLSARFIIINWIIPSRTVASFAALKRFGGYACWPYGYTLITIFYISIEDIVNWVILEGKTFQYVSEQVLHCKKCVWCCSHTELLSMGRRRQQSAKTSPTAGWRFQGAHLNL